MESPQLQYWATVQFLELVIMILVRYIREGHFDMYFDALTELPPWLFALDHTKYARWLPIHLRDMMKLSNEHPDIHREFCIGNFTSLEYNVKGTAKRKLEVMGDLIYDFRKERFGVVEPRKQRPAPTPSRQQRLKWLRQLGFTRRKVKSISKSAAEAAETGSSWIWNKYFHGERRNAERPRPQNSPLDARSVPGGTELMPPLEPKQTTVFGRESSEKEGEGQVLKAGVVGIAVIEGITRSKQTREPKAKTGCQNRMSRARVKGHVRPRDKSPGRIRQTREYPDMFKGIRSCISQLSDR
ncbi:hypothetical protein Bbelb_352620 [Branchiostoma belcheri]|nr:hypothetical protein Bbelb_352620 [Branchiostoma belcheri]